MNNEHNLKLVKLTITFVIMLLLLYIATSFVVREYILIRTEGFDNQDWFSHYKGITPKSKYKVAVIIPKSYYTSQRAFAKRLKLASQNLNWQTKIYINGSANYYDRLESYRPDFIITFLDKNNAEVDPKLAHYKIYAYMLKPANFYFGGIFNFKPKFKERKFAGVENISGFLCSFKNISLLKSFVEKKGKKFHGFKAYPTSHTTEYQGSTNSKLIYIGLNWDKLRSSKKYKILFNKLDKNKLITIYGPDKTWSYIHNSWKGFIDADQPQEIIKRTQEHGISLVLHKRRFINEGIPSSRFFESLAAGALIITDRNKFIEEFFGDNVLYTNFGNSADEMFNEIKTHLEWAQHNPELAREKAKNSHEIFRKNFTLEHDLLEIAKMHETILLRR